MYLHDLKGKHEIVRMKPHSTIADFSQKHMPDGFVGHILVDGQPSAADCTEELCRKTTITFIPALKLALVLSNGMRIPLSIPANWRVADLRRSYPGLVGPESTVRYQDQQFKEDSTFAEQEVASNSEILLVGCRRFRKLWSS